MRIHSHRQTPFARRFSVLVPAALALALAGLVPTLTACSERTDQTVDQKADQAGDDLREAGSEASDDLQRAGDKIGEGLQTAGREASERLQQAGERVQPYVEDAELTARVKTRLTAHPDVNPFQIDVDTVDGVVTLNGEVPSEAVRDAALEVARGTKGVVEVVDNLKIGVRGQ